MVKPFLIVRADTETRIGTGHVMRCLALAQAWLDSGGDAGFVMAMGAPVLETRLKSEGIEIFKISTQAGSINDAVQTVDLAKKKRANWVVLDGYHFDSSYQRKIKDSGHQLMVVDDMAHLDHYYADIVLNQNTHSESLKYTFESYTKLLLGPKYILLRREFLKWRGWSRRIPEVASKVLVTMGGSDPENVTLKVIQALQGVVVPDLEVKIVVGPSNPYLHELQSEIRNLRFKTGILHNAKNIPELMAWADVAVSAGGSTCWELCFMGLPNVILFFAENQRPIAERLDGIGGGINLGLHDRLITEEIAVVLERLIKEKRMRVEMSNCGQRVVDSYGRDRVTKIMMSDLPAI